MLKLPLKAGLVAVSLLNPVVSLAAPVSAWSLEEAPAALSDGQWLRLLELVCQNNSASAKEAVNTSHNIRVKGLADDILRDSAELAEKLQLVRAQTGLQAEESETSQVLAQQAAQELRTLQATYGGEFDHVYLQQVIDAQFAWTSLLRQAGPADLLTGLREQALRRAEVHLLFAQQLRGDLSRLTN